MVAPVIGAAVIGGLSSLAGGLIGASSAKKAAKMQLRGIREGIAFQKHGQEQSNELLRPAAQYQPALQKLMALNGLSGGQAQEDAYGAFRQTPGYQWQRDQAIEAATRGAAARGGAMSGRTTTALAGLAGNLADQEYGDYYNRLNGLFGQQLGTAGQIASNYTGTANNLANLAVQGGNAQANGRIGAGNAWSGALQGLAAAGNYGLGQWDAQRNQNVSGYSHPVY